MLDRALDSLSNRFRPIAIELIARCTEAGLPVLIINTRRSEAEQALSIKRGTSWTQNSKHLTGDAIDICPYDNYILHGPDKLMWETSDPVWKTIGTIGEQLGLRWGGRWAQKDMGHFEFVESSIKIL